MREKEIILLFVIIPAILFTVVITYLKSKRFLATRNEAYMFSLFSKKITLSRQNLIVVAVFVAFFSWLNIFLPFGVSLSITLGLLTMFPIASFKRINYSKQKETTQYLLDKLVEIEKEIEFTRQHFSSLQINLNEAQSEVDKKQKIKEELDATILEIKKNAEIWASMNDEQRELVSKTTISAISKKLKSDFWQGMVWGFIINILATLTWTLLGNPGKDDLIKKFNSLVEFFKY